MQQQHEPRIKWLRQFSKQTSSPNLETLAQLQVVKEVSHTGWTSVTRFCLTRLVTLMAVSETRLLWLLLRRDFWNGVTSSEENVKVYGGGSK